MVAISSFRGILEKTDGHELPFVKGGYSETERVEFAEFLTRPFFLVRRYTEQIRLRIRAFGSFFPPVLPAFRKVLDQCLRYLIHQKTGFDPKFKVFKGFCLDD